LSAGFFPLPLEVETGSYPSPVPGSTTVYGAGTAGIGYSNPAWNGWTTTGAVGLSQSGYDNVTEEGAPYNFPSTDTDSDVSAVSAPVGGYVLDNGTTDTSVSPSAPVGYCLVLNSGAGTGAASTSQ
jgi:hypothetical protein